MPSGQEEGYCNDNEYMHLTRTIQNFPMINPIFYFLGGLD